VECSKTAVAVLVRIDWRTGRPHSRARRPTAAEATPPARRVAPNRDRRDLLPQGPAPHGGVVEETPDAWSWRPTAGMRTPSTASTVSWRRRRSLRITHVASTAPAGSTRRARGRICRKGIALPNSGTTKSWHLDRHRMTLRLPFRAHVLELADQLLLLGIHRHHREPSLSKLPRLLV
jgi:hypothetical protein